jgi:hypothetical protein
MVSHFPVPDIEIETIEYAPVISAHQLFWYDHTSHNLDNLLAIMTYVRLVNGL